MSSAPLWQRLKRFLRRPWRDRALFVQAYILLGLARMAIKTLKFETVVKRLGSSGVETAAEVPIQHKHQALRVAWAIRAASRFTPWKSNCFPQAITGKIMLSARGIGSTVYFGAAFKEHKKMEAHAWLRCGEVYVTGGQGGKRFGIVGIFG